MAPAMVSESFLDASLDSARDIMKTARDRLGDTC